MGVLAEQEKVAPAERHYAVIEVAEMWNLSPDKVREIFQHEPGVLVIGTGVHATKGAILLFGFPKPSCYAYTVGLPPKRQDYRSLRCLQSTAGIGEVVNTRRKGASTATAPAQSGWMVSCLAKRYANPSKCVIGGKPRRSFVNGKPRTAAAHGQFEGPLKNAGSNFCPTLLLENCTNRQSASTSCCKDL